MVKILKRVINQTTSHQNMAPLKILVFVASVRPRRMADRVRKFVEGVIENHGMQPIIVDPVSFGEPGLELNRIPLHFYADPVSDAPPWMLGVNEMIQRADGFIVLSSEYNCGIPPALTNLMNTFPPSSYRHRAVGIITYSTGNFGAVRVLSFLRPYLTELGMVTVPAYATIPKVQDSLDENGTCRPGIDLFHVEKVVNELQWYGRAIKSFSVSHPMH